MKFTRLTWELFRARSHRAVSDARRWTRLESGRNFARRAFDTAT